MSKLKQYHDDRELKCDLCGKKLKEHENCYAVIKTSFKGEVQIRLGKVILGIGTRGWFPPDRTFQNEFCWDCEKELINLYINERNKEETK